ncbi:unnamed protein product [Brassicogethes aeneus]|uniref:RING-CH-type domain-containing protein n=1 Tax=Brassicogethes aeneus TaxID=1431903 RepID=A0A9P0FH03_BRAAE|nr:unnamed protein product [Brassicogethes aeneus]
MVVYFGAARIISNVDFVNFLSNLLLFCVIHHHPKLFVSKNIMSQATCTRLIRSQSAQLAGKDSREKPCTSESKKVISLMGPKKKLLKENQKDSLTSVLTTSSDEISDVTRSENKLKTKNSKLTTKNSCITLSKYVQDQLAAKKKGMNETESKYSSDLICRICHGGESMDDLVQPCRCRGTVAVVHLKCLERWLRESSHSTCELCQHHYKIIRQPKYSIPRSIFVFLRHPGEHLKEILVDLVAFALYTPSAVASTYMLMMICEALMKNNIIVSGSLSSHLIAFSAVFGIGAIDMLYLEWLMSILEYHYSNWHEWYKDHLEVKVVVSKLNRKTIRKRRRNRV